VSKTIWSKGISDGCVKLSMSKAPVKREVI
jgi:hypothetical protein